MWTAPLEPSPAECYIIRNRRGESAGSVAASVREETLMKSETVHGVTLPKIGFGTWRLGGESRADPKTDAASLAALRTALETGYTHFDTAEYYGAGRAEELLGRAVRDANSDRGKLFITTKVSPDHLAHDLVVRACEDSLRRLGLGYIDLYLVHWPPRSVKQLPETFRALNRLVADGKVRHLGVSNFKLKMLKAAQSFSETPIITDQVPYRLPDRAYAANGVLEHCRRNEILLTAYSPVKFRNLPVNKTIRAVAEAHGATPFQIALAWLVAQPRVITIPMSWNPDHIRENFRAAEIELTKKEFESLSALY